MNYFKHPLYWGESNEVSYIIDTYGLEEYAKWILVVEMLCEEWYKLNKKDSYSITLNTLSVRRRIRQRYSNFKKLILVASSMGCEVSLNDHSTPSTLTFVFPNLLNLCENYTEKTPYNISYNSISNSISNSNYKNNKKNKRKGGSRRNLREIDGMRLVRFDSNGERMWTPEQFSIIETIHPEYFSYMDKTDFGIKINELCDGASKQIRSGKKSCDEFDIFYFFNVMDKKYPPPVIEEQLIQNENNTLINQEDPILGDLL